MNILITGASSGIGEAICNDLLGNKTNFIFGCSRQIEILENKFNFHSNFHAYKCDISAPEEIEFFKRSVLKDVNNIDAIINCAGAIEPIGPFIDSLPEDWWKAIELNLRGTCFITHYFLSMLNNGGRVINFAGGGAFGVFENYSSYAISKSGIVRFTEILASELAHRDIYVNAIAPGFVKTPIHDSTLRSGPQKSGKDFFDFTVKKLAESSVPISKPVDLVKYLLSEQSRGLTGKTISASFDPWDSKTFSDSIAEINDSEIYTMKRIDLRHLEKDSKLRNCF
jgi:NAD(P)-dependent dehydrogenase (short-subunit alcohol dehydrogenase family)